MSSFVPPTGSRSRRENAQDLPVVGFLNQVADASILAAVFVVPCLLGGVLPTAQLLLGVLALCAAAAWMLGQLFSRRSAWNWIGIEPLMLLAVGLLVLQITPLPLEWRDKLSPEIASLIVPSAAAISPAPPQWQTLSVTPDATRHGLVNFVAYVLLFLVSAQRVRSVADAQRMLRWGACAACAMAAFGLVQFFFSNGKFFWYLPVKHADASDVVHGSFVNRNHLAQFLALGVGPLVILALTRLPGADQRGNRFGGRTRQPLLDRASFLQLAAWFGLALVLGAVAFSMSRGGMIAAGVALVVCLAVCQRSRLLDDKVLVGAFVLGAAMVVALFLPGANALESRLSDQVASFDLEKIDAGSARRKIWEAVAEGIQAFPIVGSGVGSHRYVYPLYFDHIDNGTEYTTAESGFLQIGLESGGAGLALLIVGIAFAAFRMLRAAWASRMPEKTACLAAVLAAVVATSAHALVETHWFMPGCMVLLAVLAGCGFGLSSPDAAGGQLRVFRAPRIIWIGGLAGLLWCASTAFPVHLRTLRNAELLTKIDTISRQTADGDATLSLSRRELDSLGDLQSTSPRAHLQLAKLHLQTFESLQRGAENPMTLADLRQAAMNAEFASNQQRREWLLRATSGNADLLFRAQAHLQRCLQCCPLEGHAFLHAADLCFVDGGDVDAQQALIAEARRVRPFDAQVDFAAGQLAWQTNDLDGALAQWRKSYDRSHRWRETIARLLINFMPAEEFLSVFEPDWRTLRELQHQMGQAGHAEYALVARRFADLSVQRAKEVLDGSEETLLREALNIYRRLGDHEAVAACALQAVRFAPGSYDAHATAARALTFLGRDQESLDHLRWCLQRKPNDQLLSDLFRAVMERAGRGETIVLTNYDAEQSGTQADSNNLSNDSHSGVVHSDSSQPHTGPTVTPLFGNESLLIERNR